MYMLKIRYGNYPINFKLGPYILVRKSGIAVALGPIKFCEESSMQHSTGMCEAGFTVAVILINKLRSKLQ